MAEAKLSRRQEWLHEVIFEADTPTGKAFDVALIIAILMSVAIVMVDSVASLHDAHGRWLYMLEWFFTILFTVEYILRLYCVARPLKYALSFYGIVDLLSILPTYLSLLLPGTQYLLVIRTLRTIRIWRVFKLVHFLREMETLFAAMRASFKKITVFMGIVLCLVTVLGSIMYVVEPAESGFTSIPRSVYWAIVTLTTVGYGDISPKTPLGQFIASLAMMLGYAIIAVPTGIVTVELSQLGRRKKPTTQNCRVCNREGHDHDAVFCKYCGERLNPVV